MSIAQWEETSAIAMDRLRQCLREGKSAVVDDTFSRRFLRDRCKAAALEFGAEFTIVFVDTPIEEIRSRRAANYQTPTRHHVRDDVFENHYKTFQFPTADEPVVLVVEGFDLQSWLTGEEHSVRPLLAPFPPRPCARRQKHSRNQQLGNDARHDIDHVPKMAGFWATKAKGTRIVADITLNEA